MAHRVYLPLLVFVTISLLLKVNSVASIENRRPKFQDCLRYKPTLEEEQPPGTPVVQVNAADPDRWQTVEYSIVAIPGDQEFFTIDKTTGQIVSAFVFDRDAPFRDQEFNITVRATDNGSPSLDDVCTLKVTILDINDNPPTFDKDVYEASVTKDIHPNQRVTTISAMDMDERDNNNIRYEIVQENEDSSYFDIDKNNGTLTLAKPIDREPGQLYTFLVRAYNEGPLGTEIQQAKAVVKVRVVDSDIPAPYFIKMPAAPIVLNESFSDFTKNIAEFEAVSNDKVKDNLVLTIARGNSNRTFLVEQISNTACIKLARALDYELVTTYTLTIRATNAYGMVAEALLKINILDENDNVPEMIGEPSGTIAEHEPPGTFVMQVHAQDRDGTADNNIVSYHMMGPNEQYFHIHNQTGIVTSLVEFDRNAKDIYSVTVMVEDNSPSVLTNNGEPNRVTKHLFIRIMDRNYQIPQFEKSEYVVDCIPENATINTSVVQVKAYDQCITCTMKYTIVKNNVQNAFSIDENTGRIRVSNQLDYEAIPEYDLFVMANNGRYNRTVLVVVKIGNINDNPPKFHELQNITILEEAIPNGCITSAMPYDPDIENFETPQALRYTYAKAHEHLLNIDDSGCIRLLQPLDRDPPHGSKLWQINITATDEDGKGKSTTVTLNITLDDINDNAPYLTNQTHVVWSENRSPGLITKLTAKDADEEHNGPPFFYTIHPDASWEIKQRFQVVDDELHATIKFDREEQKEYSIPILISDSGVPQMSAISTLVIEIGDENDNEMRYGEKHVVVHKLNGKMHELNVGRVYVSDPDDWDLLDKTFWLNESSMENNQKCFELNTSTGMITILEDTPRGEYNLQFRVHERSKHFTSHHVSAVVIVDVKELSEAAIDRSGSIRFYNVTAKEFMSNTPDHPDTPFQRLQTRIATILNTSPADVDIFTINNRKLAHGTFLDVFFAVHDTIYSTSDVLNGVLSLQRDQLEEEVGFPIDMIGIDECETKSQMCEQSCRNKVYTSNKPIVVDANATSFVGITTFVRAECVTEASFLTCFNGGTLIGDSCICPNSFDGLRCEMLDISFNGNGYAIYPSIKSDTITSISIGISPRQTVGLLLYIGPLSYNPRVSTQPFLALELIDGTMVLLLDDGTEAFRIEDQHVFSEDDTFIVTIVLEPQAIMMITVVNESVTSKCRYEYENFSGVLNTNGPIHLGGTVIDLAQLGSLYNWRYVPQTRGFSGSIRSLIINEHTIDFQQSTLAKNATLGQTVDIKTGELSYRFVVGIVIVAFFICFCGLFVFNLAYEFRKKSSRILAQGNYDQNKILSLLNDTLLESVTSREC